MLLGEVQVLRVRRQLERQLAKSVKLLIHKKLAAKRSWRPLRQTRDPSLTAKLLPVETPVRARNHWPGRRKVSGVAGKRTIVFQNGDLIRLRGVLSIGAAIGAAFSRPLSSDRAARCKSKRPFPNPSLAPGRMRRRHPWTGNSPTARLV